jgi:hypothetical protein
MLGISIGLNSVSTHAACTAVFVAVAAILGFCFASIRTLGKIGWLAWIGLVCIMTASESLSLLLISNSEANLDSLLCHSRSWPSG